MSPGHGRAVVLQHMDREGPGLIAPVCAKRGLGLEIVRLDLGVPVPATLAASDVLVVMGGSMGVGDLDDPRYPHLRREVELLRDVLAKRQPVLGVCLGAQLLAHAAGARVYPNQGRGADGVLRPVREVGFGHVRLHGQDQEPVLAGLPNPLPVLHWHGDTFDLPAGATHLAATDACAHQAFRLGRRAFALQFHVEADAELARTWAREDAAYAESALGPEGPAEIMAMSDDWGRAMRGPGERFIHNILDQMLAD